MSSVADHGDSRNLRLRSAIAGWLAGFTVAFAFSWVLTNAYEALLVLVGRWNSWLTRWRSHPRFRARNCPNNIDKETRMSALDITQPAAASAVVPRNVLGNTYSITVCPRTGHACLDDCDHPPTVIDVVPATRIRELEAGRDGLAAELRALRTGRLTAITIGQETVWGSQEGAAKVRQTIAHLKAKDGEAERSRLREALETIATGRIPNVRTEEGCFIAAFARQALDA